LESEAFNESEMALFSECRPQCAQTVLDTADIVREGDVSTATLDLEGAGAAFVRVFLWHGSHAVVSMKIELDDKENPLIVGFLKPERARVQFPHTWETQPSYS